MGSMTAVRFLVRVSVDSFIWASTEEEARERVIAELNRDPSLVQCFEVREG